MSLQEQTKGEPVKVGPPLVLIRFSHFWRNHQPGDEAGFAPDVAEKILKAGAGAVIGEGFRGPHPSREEACVGEIVGKAPRRQ